MCEQCPGNYCFVVHSSTPFPLTLCHATVSVAKVQSEGVSGGQRASAGCVIRAHLFCLRKVIAKVVSIFQKRERSGECKGEVQWDE